MNPRKLALFALGASLLAGCTMNTAQNLDIHEALLYGATSERIGWVYGQLGAQGTSSLKLGAQTLTLRPQVQDALALPGTLSLNGQSTFRAPTTAVLRKINLTKNVSGDNYTVAASANVDAVFVTDGRAWFRLTDRLSAGATVALAPRGATNLRGAGRLTDAEADALGASLLNQGPLAVAVIPEAEVPDAPLAAQPAPRTYLRTGLYVQQGVQTALAPITALPAPVGGGLGGELARGTNSAVGEQAPSVYLSRSQADLAAAYRLAYGNQVPAPSAPSVNFAGNSVVTFFLGQRPTGGYSVRFLNARASGDTLTVTVQVNQPGPGAITTQALTSPWVSVRVPGLFERVVVQDASGQVLAQSN